MSYDLGSQPIRMKCPHCKAKMTTKISNKISNGTHFDACIMFMCFFPLAWLPYCVSRDKTEHRCSKCDALIGTVNPFSSSECIVCKWCYEDDIYDEVITYDGNHYVYFPENYVCDSRQANIFHSNELPTSVEDSGAVDAAVCFII
ncbi:unnamed protein product [Chironomus riparius]|uniref:LITAF domain-containing protein n=1 Tax=Chironomus riparius TaxID=315576 RepID=A0A9N9WXH8_9DIPT|nr:unnamed protein product [Chironomus riparius]